MQPTITFKLPALTLLVVPAGLVVAGLGLLRLAGEHHSAPIGSAGFYLLFLSIAMLVLGLVPRVQLSPAGVRIRALRGSRLIGWPEINAVTVEPQRRGGPRVVLWTAPGGQVRLPLPVAGSGPDRARHEAAFLRGYHQIGQYWLATRTPDPHALAAPWHGLPPAGRWPAPPPADRWPEPPPVGC